MKRSTAIAVCLLAFAPCLLRGAVVIPPGMALVSLNWNDYPTNKLSTNLTFRVHGVPALGTAVTNWPVLATLVGTNTSAQVMIPTPSANYFFAVSGSNLFGQVFFSSVATLSPPVDGSATINLTGAQTQ